MEQSFQIILCHSGTIPACSSNKRYTVFSNDPMYNQRTYPGDGGLKLLQNWETSPLCHLRDIRHLVARNMLTVLAVVAFYFGCLFDHLTTLYGVSLPTISEVNPVVLRLMEVGIWFEVEIVVILMGILYGIVISSMKPSKLNALSANALTAVGLTRALVAFSNFTLIINAL